MLKITQNCSYFNIFPFTAKWNKLTDDRQRCQSVNQSIYLSNSTK